MTFADKVAIELQKARAANDPMHSAHEAYAVILEELDEFKVEVFKKRMLRNKDAMLNELVQIGAMVQRTAEDLELCD